MNKIKPFLYLLMNWSIIIACIFIVKANLFFFPVAFFVISNRQFANYLAGHEGLHGHLSKNNFFNDFFARLFCLGPVFVSLQSYREKHLLHHEFLGTPIDPDKGLYNFYPVGKRNYLKKISFYFISFKMLRDFLIYYTPLFEFNKKQFYRREKIIDFIFYLFIGILFSWGFIFIFGWRFYLSMWLGPLLLLMPYYYFVGALQHGLIHEKEDIEASRNIDGNQFLMELLLPCATNYHGAHHLFPNVPFYYLKKVCYQKKMHCLSYAEAVKKLIF